MMPAGPDTIEHTVFFLCVCVHACALGFWMEWDVLRHIKALFVLPLASGLWGLVVLAGLFEGRCRPTAWLTAAGLSVFAHSSCYNRGACTLLSALP